MFSTSVRSCRASAAGIVENTACCKSARQAFKWGGGGGAINTTTNQPSLISKHAKLNVFTTDLTFKSTFNAHSGFEIANLASSINSLFILPGIHQWIQQPRRFLTHQRQLSTKNFMPRINSQYQTRFWYSSLAWTKWNISTYCKCQQTSNV